MKIKKSELTKIIASEVEKVLSYRDNNYEKKVDDFYEYLDRNAEKYTNEDLIKEIEYNSIDLSGEIELDTKSLRILKTEGYDFNRLQSKLQLDINVDYLDLDDTSFNAYLSLHKYDNFVEMLEFLKDNYKNIYEDIVSQMESAVEKEFDRTFGTNGLFWVQAHLVEFNDYDRIDISLYINHNKLYKFDLIEPDFYYYFEDSRDLEEAIELYEDIYNG